jgi:hypothetical protein
MMRGIRRARVSAADIPFPAKHENIARKQAPADGDA